MLAPYGYQQQYVQNTADDIRAEEDFYLYQEDQRRIHEEHEAATVEAEKAEADAAVTEHVTGIGALLDSRLPANLSSARDLVNEYIYVNSIDRESRFASPGQFTIQLQDEITGIVSVAITQIQIPLTDPAVRPGRSDIVFQIDTGTIMSTAVPTGNYNGPELALELATQMNMDIHAVAIGASTAFINFATGLAYDDAAFLVQKALNVEVTHIAARDMFIFQIVDATNAPTNASTLSLYIKVVSTGDYSSQITDIYDIIGFSRSRAASQGTYVPLLNMYMITTAGPATGFGGGADLDRRYHYSLHSDMACKTKGADFAFISIDALDYDDYIQLAPSTIIRSYTGIRFAKIYLNEASNSREPAVSINTDPLAIKMDQQRDTLSLKTFTLTLYRPDGTIFDLGGQNWSITLKITRTGVLGDITRSTSSIYNNLVFGQ